MALSDALVQIIEERATEIAQKWYRETRQTPYVPSLNSISEDDALEMATNVYRRLSHWMTPSGEAEIKETYQRFGESLFYRGFRMEEVVMILILIKRYLWLHLLEQGLMTTNLDVYQALDVNNKVVLYFDRAIYFALIGFREARAANRKAIAGA
ncbi:MAG: RsbRD N-terminal domain-containing protein [Actinomycetota bacterium]